MVLNSLISTAGTVQDHQSVHSQSIAGQEVTEVHVLRTSQNQMTSCSSTVSTYIEQSIYNTPCYNTNLDITWPFFTVEFYKRITGK